MKKRSECPFPFSGNYCASFIENAWYCGWLNDYSNEHFLIKAINNQLTSIEWEQQLLCNNVYSSSTTISSNGKVDYKKFSLNFVINLSMKLSAMNITFGENKIKKFIEDQLSAGKSSYDNDKFFQALSEIEILSFYCRQTGGNKATYEPPIGMNGANPEAQFIIRDSLTATNVTVNVEVKTPKFPAAIKNREKILIPTILLSDVGRKEIEKLCVDNNYKCIMPRVTKLVQFINSAANKFEIPKENEYNILYINWSYGDFPSNAFLEPWSLLTNERNGILTHPEIGMNLHFDTPILKEAYEKITAIVVYTNSLEQLMFSEFRYSWQGSFEVGPRFRMFILNENLREKISKEKYNIFFRITGMNPSVLEPRKWTILVDHNHTDTTPLDLIVSDYKFSSDALNIVNNNYLL